MKITTLGLVAATFFLFATGSVLADDRDHRDRHVIAAGAADGWRLGERTRGGFAIYRRAGRGWYRVPGAAVDIADGWVLGTKRESGGYAIYRWNGRGWDQAPGGAVQIGGSYRRPWVVNNRGQRFTWNGYDWDADYGYQRAFNGRHDNNRYDDVYDWRRGYLGGQRNDRRDHDRSRHDRNRHDEDRHDDTRHSRRGNHW